MTTELGSFDASRLGAFRASQFGDARSGAGGFYVNIGLAVPPWGFYGAGGIELFDTHVADFNTNYALFSRRGLNILFYSDEVPGFGPGGGLLPAGRSLPVGLVGVKLSIPFTIGEWFTALELGLAGMPNPTVFAISGWWTDRYEEPFVTHPPLGSLVNMIRTRWGARWPGPMGEGIAWLYQMAGGIRLLAS